MNIDNLIGGQPINLSKKYFIVKSQFYENFYVYLADSNHLDLSILISKTKHSWEQCQNINFKERVEILEKAANSLTFSEEEIDSIVKMVGMPKKYVLEQIQQIPKIMTSFWKIVSDRYGFKYGKIGLDFIKNGKVHKIEFRIPKSGFVYAITPGNDQRITALISTVLVLLGFPGIIKPSKVDNIIPLKVVKAIIDAGYPKNGLGVLFFNSEGPNANEYNFKLCDESSVIWPFGDNLTVDNLIRIEKQQVINLDKFAKEKKITDIKKEFQTFLNELKNSRDSIDDYIEYTTIDHFSSKLVLRHASGRCAGILDNNFDVSTAAKLILNSSMKYPIGCNSLKSVYVVEPVFDELVKKLKQELNYLDKYTSDPIKSNTEVGYINPETALFLNKRIEELKLLKLVSILHGGKQTGPLQFTPLLVSTNDINSELLINEIPAYILCLTKVKSFEDAVYQINKITENNLKLVVSYFTNNPKNMRLQVNAHHVKINHLTTDIDGLIHEGNDYIMQLTRPYVVHLEKKYLNTHPYVT